MVINSRSEHVIAQVSSRGRRVQIVCVAVALLVAASSMGNASVAEVNPAPPRSTTLPSHDLNIGALRAFQELTPAKARIAEPAAAPKKKSDSAGKVIYLTFDDGPAGTYTRRILDVLDRYDAKATFFELGERASAHPELTRLVVARGHALGSHTWNHKDLRKLGRGKLNRQITRTSAALGRISGRPITCLRPPYGAANKRVKSAIHRKGLKVVMWDIDPRDWRKPGVAAITRRVVSTSHSGAVSLMHDGGGNRSQSVRALERILHKLSKKGYAFKTLPGC